MSGMFQRCHAAGQLAAQGNQRALKVLASLLDHLIFLRARSNTLVLLAEASCHDRLPVAET